MTAQKALNWAKKNKNYPWIKAETKVKDLTPTKKGLLMKAYEKSLTKKAAAVTGGARTYQYTVYLPEDYSDTDALKYWSKSPLVKKTSGVDLGKELTAEGGRPIYDKGTYHVFKAKKLHPIGEWKEATKGRPKGFVSETGKNFGYTGGIVKKLAK
tara:strand:+ start:123 stop:587 length:465 start_codon:yes stop_codon:yes gene_type:complete